MNQIGRGPRWEGETDGKATQMKITDVKTLMHNWKTKFESIQWPSQIELTQQIKHTTSLCWETYLIFKIVNGKNLVYF